MIAAKAIFMNRQTFLGYIYAAAGSALFSTKAIFIKIAYIDQVNPPLMLALRNLMALPFFVVVGIYAWRRMLKQGTHLPSGKLIGQALLTGFIGYYISSLLDFEGLVYISAQLERLVLFTYPIFVIFLGAMFFNTRLTMMSLICASITYLGLLVVFMSALPEGGRNTWIGTALVLGCALTFALYQLLAKKFISLMGSTLFTSVALSGSAVACIAHYVLVSRSFDFSSSPRFFEMAAGCALFATVLPSFMVNAGLSRISAQSTAMISSISPIITISLAVWILGEHFTLADAIGSAMVIAGITIYAMTDKKPEREIKQLLAGEIEPA